MNLSQKDASRLAEICSLDSLFPIIKETTPIQEARIQLGLCPVCETHEGIGVQMRLLGDFGPMRGWQCGRCQIVCVTKNPNAK